MIQISDKTQCCGCTACMSICPHDAIIMKPDELGFKYPLVDIEKCTECGLCEKVCSFNKNYNKTTNLSTPLLYAVRHKNMNHISTSRSGAAFIAISDFVLKQKGVVYGATFNEFFSVVHKRATSIEERDAFKGSKYVQSDLNSIFRQIKTDLKNGELVLFSGTSCQTAGLRSYIPQKLQNRLILVDLICHGVPSPRIWDDYLVYIKNKYKKSIITVNFRDKSKYGWDSHMESFILSNGKKIYRKTWTSLFYKHIMFRPSCSVCYFTNLYRPSDFTIADYWGIEKLSPTFNADNKGCSLLFLNTAKAVGIFSSIKSDIYVIPTKIGLCMQPNMKTPSKFHTDWQEFEKEYLTKGFIWAAKKYGDLGYAYKVNSFITTLKRILYPIYNYIISRK